MNISTVSVPVIEDAVSEKLLFVTVITLRVCVNSVLALAGFVVNIVNLLVFWKMGLDQSTESFFLISLADCLTGFFGIFGGLSNSLRYLGPPHIALSMYPIYILALVTCSVSGLMSMVSTAVLAVVRCCSVALPFQVRTIFRARRQRFVILFCTVVFLAFLIYGLTGTRMIIRTHPQSNISYLALKFHPEYIERNQFADVYRGVLFYFCFFTVSVCLIILIVALRRSYKFRTLSQRSGTDISGQSDRKNHSDSQTSKESKKLKPGSKESQVVTVVVLVSAIFTICNLPVMIISIFQRAVPELNNVGKLRRSYDFAMTVGEFLQLLNATINIAVYLKFNTRYHAAFLRLMKRA